MTDHTHWWLVGDPSGGVALGTCKGCGAWRVFNSKPVDDFNPNSAHATDRQRALLNGRTWQGYEEYRPADEGMA